MALPAGYAEIIDLYYWPSAEMIQVARKAGGGMSMLMRPEHRVVADRNVSSVELLTMVEKTQGTMSGKLPEGVLQVKCW